MSDLLSQASLVMIPSGYKEDVVYSPIPTNGNGDLSFTRASNGTRINSAGLVEVTPWNLVEYSEDFTNVFYAKVDSSVIGNTATAPNGTTTADSLLDNTSNFIHALTPTILKASTEITFTFSVYAKFKDTGRKIQISMDDAVAGGVDSGVFNLSTGAYDTALGTPSAAFTNPSRSFESVGNGWYKLILTVTSNAQSQIRTNIFVCNSSNASFYVGNGTGIFIWGAQLNIGATAKPYFPTTDRLNVPRLTYQNGGGGCPSLLLEKQSTNLFSYSEDFTNAYWTKYNGQSITANATTSPDGTQNADKMIDAGGFYAFATFTASTSYSLSVFIKKDTATSFDFGYIDQSVPSFIGGAITYTFSTGAIVVSQSANSSVSGEAFDFGNGWIRLVIKFTASATKTYDYQYFELNGGDAFIYGFQLEASSYPTSYIPTTSSSATRVADACFKTGIGALIGGTSGTVFFDIKTNPVLSGSQYKQFCYYVTSGGSQSYLFLDGSNKITTNSNWGNLFFSTTPFVPNTRYKVALVFAPNDFALYINGVSVATASSGTPNNNVDLQIGQFNGTEMCEFVFNQYTHFPSRLTNAELASLTTL